MDVRITEKKNDDLLKRTEVSCDILHDGEPTPKRDDIRKNVAGQLNVNEKLVVLESIRSIYGGGSKAILHVYKNEKEMMSKERKYILIRNKILKSEKKEEAPAEKKEETPPEKPTEKIEEKEDGKEEKGTEDKGKENKEEKANE